LAEIKIGKAAVVVKSLPGIGTRTIKKAAKWQPFLLLVEQASRRTGEQQIQHLISYPP
jgi:hypothetical protein